jgi:hypothetical protein
MDDRGLDVDIHPADMRDIAAAVMRGSEWLLVHVPQEKHRQRKIVYQVRATKAQGR